MGKDEGSCFGCLPWGRKAAPSSRPMSPAGRAGTRRPVSAIKKSGSSKLPARHASGKMTVVKASSAKAVRSSTSRAEAEPAPQWRSQVGASDDNSSSDDDEEDGETKKTVKPIGLGVTAFPSDFDATHPTARLTNAFPSESPRPPHHLAPLSPPRLSAGGGGGSLTGASPPSFATSGGFSGPLPRTFGSPNGGQDGVSGVPGTAASQPVDAATRLAELQQRFRAKSAARTRPSGPGTVPAGILGAKGDADRATGDQMECSSFSYNASAHGAGPRGQTPLSPLRGGGSSAGPGVGNGLSAGLGGVGHKGSPLRQPGAVGGGEPPGDSLAAAIPGSLPSMTQGSVSGSTPGSPTRDFHGRPPPALMAGASHSSPFLGPSSPAMAALAAAPRATSSTGGQQQGAPLTPRGLAQSTSNEPDAFSFVTPQWQPGRKPAAGAQPRSPGAADGTAVAHGHTHHHTHGAVGYHSSLAPGPTSAGLGALSGSRQLDKLQSGKVAFADGPGPEMSKMSERPSLSGAGRTRPGSGDNQQQQPPHQHHPQLLQDRSLGRSSSSGKGLGGAALSRGQEPLFSSRAGTGDGEGSRSGSRGQDPRDGGNGGLRAHPGQAPGGPQRLQHQSSSTRQRQQQPLAASGGGGSLARQEDEDDDSASVAVEERPQLATGRVPEKRVSGSGGAGGVGAGGAGGGDGPTWASNVEGGEGRPLTPAMQLKAVSMRNEAMLSSLLSGKGGLDFAPRKGPGDGDGTAAELERFDRVKDAMSRLDDILGAPSQVPGRSLNARSGATENAATDFDGSAPAYTRPAIPVKPW